MTTARKRRLPAPRDIDEYIAGFPKDVQRILQEMRSVIRDAAPEAVEAIRYGIPTFILRGNLVHFAGFQKHIGFYPTPSAIEAFRGELAKYKRAKGSIQFPLDKPVPVSLVRRMVKFRVKETREKLAIKKPHT